MIIVRFADLTGTGFSRHVPKGEDPEPEKYWQAANNLVDSVVKQPPPTIRDTGRHPIWSLRWVYVENRPMWCFSVQGKDSGARFGVAGTCRFGFADAALHPADVWRTGRELVAGDDPVDEATLTADMSEDIGTSVWAALTRHYGNIRIDLSPTNTAAVIEYLLSVVSINDSKQYVWSTCMLQPVDYRLGGKKLAVVYGLGAELLQSSDPILLDLVTRQFGGTVPSLPDSRGADRAPADIPDAPRTRPRADLEVSTITPVARAKPTDKSGADPTRDVRAEQSGTSAVPLSDVAPWVRNNWKQALAVLDRPGGGHPQQNEIFECLLNLSLDTGVNKLGLPTSAGPASYEACRRLAALMRAYCDQPSFGPTRTPKWLVEEIHRKLRLELADLVAARKVWRLLEVSPTHDDYAVAAVLAEAKAHGLTDDARWFLSQVAEPFTAIHRYSGTLVAMHADDAAALITAIAQRHSARETGKRATQAVKALTLSSIRERGGERVTWVNTFLDRLPNRPIYQHVMAGALEALAEDHRTSVLPPDPGDREYGEDRYDTLLRHVRHIGFPDDKPPRDVAKLLRRLERQPSEQVHRGAEPVTVLRKVLLWTHPLFTFGIVCTVIVAVAVLSVVAGALGLTPRESSDADLAVPATQQPHAPSSPAIDTHGPPPLTSNEPTNHGQPSTDPDGKKISFPYRLGNPPDEHDPVGDFIRTLEQKIMGQRTQSITIAIRGATDGANRAHIRAKDAKSFIDSGRADIPPPVDVKIVPYPDDAEAEPGTVDVTIVLSST